MTPYPPTRRCDGPHSDRESRDCADCRALYRRECAEADRVFRATALRLGADPETGVRPTTR